jgi:hypothetical protein
MDADWALLADLVILEDDPGIDINAFSKVPEVVRHGQLLDPTP